MEIRKVGHIEVYDKELMDEFRSIIGHRQLRLNRTKRHNYTIYADVPEEEEGNDED